MNLPPAGATPLLDVRGLHKRFGGVVASDGVDLQLNAGELHALIGPNGAGKTTLVAQLAGQLPPDSGRIVFSGRDITALSAHQRARLGLARSFQVTRLFRSFNVIEHLALALQAAVGVRAAWRAAARDSELFDRAADWLPRLGLLAQARTSIDALSHGQRRALEVGMAVAAAPRLVLLDEPMAGLGLDESPRMEALIAGLREHTALLLIEHDVNAVFRLADRVSVLVSGRIVASGRSDDVRRDPLVIGAYLGVE